MKKAAPAKKVEQDIKKFIHGGLLYIKGPAGAVTGHHAWVCRIKPAFSKTQFVTVKRDGTVKVVGEKIDDKHEKCDCLQVPGNFGHFDITLRNLTKIVHKWVGWQYTRVKTGAFEHYYSLFKKSKK